ncbi:MAG TPA: Rieske (2Fe-2S) protein [Fimbriimonadaceae bacterium]|nr:Rieske (2Fe-2S) protein [Fimbriimonadaceae bacterium]
MDHETQQPTPPLDAEAMARRKFLGRVVTVLNIAVVGVLAVPAVQFAAAPLKHRLKEEWLDVLGDDELAEGETREVAYTVAVQDGYQKVDRKYVVYLSRQDGEVKCFDPACTHLGCRVKYQSDQHRYFCPCHGGVFDESGKVVSGPPPKGLIQHPVKVEGGRIYVSRMV